MIDLAQAVRKALGSVDGPPILSACFALPPIACQALVAAGAVCGVVSGDDGPMLEPLAVGRWTDASRSAWTIEPGRARSLVHVGHPSQVGHGMCRSAREAGIRRIVTVDAAGSILAIRSLAGFRGVLALPRWLRPDPALALRPHAALGFEEAFDHLLSIVGDRFRAGIPRGECEEGRAVLILGSLGPGGAERQAALSAIGLQQGGRWKPTVACSIASGAGYDFHRASVEAAGIPLVELPALHPRMNEPWIREVLAAARTHEHLGFHNIAHAILNHACCLRDLRPSLVQTWMDTSNVLAGIAAHLVDVPALVLAGRSMAPDNFTVYQPYMRPGYKALLSRRKPVFTNNSAAGARDYQRWLGLPDGAVTVLRNGFAFPDEVPANLRATMRARLGIPENASVLGTIMRFSEEKRPWLWVDVAARVVDALPSVTCIAFGSGALLEETRGLVRARGLVDRILLPGLTDDAWSALACMDLFLLASRMEGLPNVLVEAQGMGVPVVSAGHGGMRETYDEGRTGWTAASDDALAATVIDLLRSPERLRASGAAASSFVRGRFGVGRMVVETEAMFAHALRDGRSAAAATEAGRIEIPSRPERR